MFLIQQAPATIEAKRPRDSASEPGSPLQVDDDDKLVVDVPPSPSPLREYSTYITVKGNA